MFEISRDVEQSDTTDGQSRSSSTDRDTIVERIVGVSQAGVELEYDLPKSTTTDQRADQWQLPVRVLRPPTGPLQLLNRPELAARAAAWLKAGGLTDAACGHWIFTWNAFRIDCDPQSAVDIVDGFDLGPDNLAAGALYHDPDALSPAPLIAKPAPRNGAVLFVEMAIDPEVVRRSKAQTDVVTGEILRKPMTLDAALQAHATDQISGTIAVTFELDAAGHVRRQTKVATVITVTAKAPGSVETHTSTETLDRRLVSGPHA